MCKAIDCAKFFIKRDSNAYTNTFDGNMKLQKLLFFVNFISISTRGKRLFNDPMYAFRNGCVIENIRLRYKNDFIGLHKDSETFNPEFSQDEYDILNTTFELFGSLSAKELSELNRTFDCWKNAYENTNNKETAVISDEDMFKEADKILSVINTYKTNKTKDLLYEEINGIIFCMMIATELFYSRKMVRSICCFAN